jgi:hypothetical protein
MTYRRGTRLCRSVLIGVSVLITYTALVAQIPIDPLPPDRRITWQPGVVGGIPTVPVAVNVRAAPFNAVGDDTAAFRSAINAVTSSGAVWIPAGSYRLTGKLTIGRSIVLRGAGLQVTHLLFDHASDAIEFVTYQRGPWVNIAAGHTRGSTQLIVADGSSFTPGGYTEIQQANDPAVMYTLPEWNQSWAANSVGQIVTIVGVTDNQLTITPSLRLDLQSALTPTIRSQRFVEQAGLEQLHLKRLDTSDTHVVTFKNVANVWMRDCISELAAKAHVTVEAGYHVEIRDNTFNDATQWGGGGHGYGVVLGLHVTDSLVENNLFRHLRHSMLIQLGANGNVFGYNYSREPYQSDGTNWTPPDISVHGHYPFENLFEGNIVQEVGIADYWGPAGPYNTFFRNRVEAEDIDLEDSSNTQNLLGNELVTGDIVWDQDSRYPHHIDPATLLRQGNRIHDALIWNPPNTDHFLPVSYYRTAQPAFYGCLSWPSLGADLPGGTNPARERYLHGGVLACSAIYLPVILASASPNPIFSSSSNAPLEHGAFCVL